MHQDSISHDIWILWKCFNGLKNTFVYQIKKFVPSFFKRFPNRFLYHHTFLCKTLWKLYDPFMTFRLQMWRMNYLHISKSFSVCLWNIFENITGMPLRGHLLAARILDIWKSNQIQFFFEKQKETVAHSLFSFHYLINGTHPVVDKPIPCSYGLVLRPTPR